MRSAPSAAGSASRHRTRSRSRSVRRACRAGASGSSLRSQGACAAALPAGRERAGGDVVCGRNVLAMRCSRSPSASSECSSAASWRRSSLELLRQLRPARHDACAPGPRSPRPAVRRSPGAPDRHRAPRDSAASCAARFAKPDDRFLEHAQRLGETRHRVRRRRAAGRPRARRAHAHPRRRPRRRARARLARGLGEAAAIGEALNARRASPCDLAVGEIRAPRVRRPGSAAARGASRGRGRAPPARRAPPVSRRHSAARVADRLELVAVAAMLHRRARAACRGARATGIPAGRGCRSGSRRARARPARAAPGHSRIAASARPCRSPGAARSHRRHRPAPAPRASGARVASPLTSKLAVISARSAPWRSMSALARPPMRQHHGVDDDRLAGAGFAGERRQAARRVRVRRNR